MDALHVAAQRAATAALRQQQAGTASLRDGFSFPETDCQVVLPEGFPGLLEQGSQRLVIGLAGDDVPIRLNAHIIERRTATLHAQIEQYRVEVAILCGRVPDQALLVLSGHPAGDLQKGRQAGLGEAIAHRQATP